MSEEIRILKKALKHAENLTLAKSTFLAQAAHDLKQPMQSLFVFVNSLQESNLTAEQKELVDKIEFSAENLKNLLNSLLDVSQLELGAIKPNFEECDIGKVLFQLQKEFEPLAEQSNILFKVINTDAKVYTDSVLLSRMIRNLLSNAFKYGANRVLLVAKKQEDDVKIMVTDNGEGIKEEDFPHIFDEFYRAKNMYNRHKGSGLGLSIVKKISRIIGTHIMVKNNKNKGCCFCFNLKVKNKSPKMI